MPGVRTHLEPAAAAQERTASDEAELLERSLQTEFEEDVARIFDESLYSDLELVCGRSKIKTHTCILKARTHKFYQKLDNILHVDINQNTYDEIYSFISDAYTECNIRHQEKEIIQYLKDNLDIPSIEAKLPLNPCEIADNLNARSAAGPARREPEPEPEVFLTPRCASPSADKRRSVSSSPSIELTKEYYALVPIDPFILEKELKEQDALSNAFQSIIKTQPSDFQNKSPNRNKPTSLSIRSSHSSKNPIHTSNKTDLTKKSKLNSCTRISNGSDIKLNPPRDDSQVIQIRDASGIVTKVVRESSRADRVAEAAISPDSLASAADEPSSSSDYLSATTFSPGASSAGCPSLINAESVIKMDQAFTSSDSGLESAHLLESLNGQIDVILSDLSLTESTLHDLTVDENSRGCSPPPDEATLAALSQSQSQSSANGSLPIERPATNKTPKYVSKSSKEEKQRHNEEIVTLESSSLSSETGSWEPVFPIKQTDKDLCTSFLTNERNTVNPEKTTQPPLPLNDDSAGPAQQSPFKSKFCFIDASSLVDDDEDRTKIQSDNKPSQSDKDPALPTPSQPVPCSASKHDASPNDWSEGHEHDDSLEQADTKDPDSLQKDLSPTIFDMTPITEDSLSTNPFETAARAAEQPAAYSPHAARDNTEPNQTKDVRDDYFSEHVIVSSTPHNSIMSVRPTAKQSDFQYSDSNSGTLNHVAHQEIKPSSLKKLPKFTEGSPIVSGGASVEDHLPQPNSFVGSPLTRRKLDNAPIVSGAYIPDDEPAKHVRKSPKSLCAPAWVVDMSDTESKVSSESLSSAHNKRPGDRACENLRSESKYSSDNISKSRSSVDSDSSERSSHRFYIDLASLPEPAPAPPETTSKSVNEKKNIFSMYIDLGENTALKEMPARLSSSLNAKKITETKSDKTSKSNGKSANPNKSITIFERYEALCSNPDISIREIISMPSLKPDPNTDADQCPNTEKSDKPEPAKKQVIEKSTRLSSSELFVRLSDLDKPSPKKMLDSSFTIYEHKVSDIRMTRSIPDSGWAGRADVISSFHSENAASLNRLFPHLRTEFSRSMPGSLARARSPPAPPDHPSDMSEISSVQSSYCRSVVENSTTEDSHSQTSSLIGSCQSKLGQDLLRMFLEEIAPDVVVEVSGKRFKAHKCILSSRCQYFAGILSGGWVESAGNVIILPPFSYNVVHFALCHIYSGLSTIPDSVSILELATIADMLGLEGLKEAIMFTLKAKYCHHFHKPCSVCTAGVLECFPLSSVYGLDDLYRKCLRWITKHFHKVWPTKAFATLPKELLDKCYQQHIINMSMDNVIDTICACGITEASLSNARWAEVVGSMCRRLLNAAAQFAAARLSGCVRAAGALPPDLPPPAAAALDAALAAALDWAEPHETCRTYALLSYLVKELKSQHTARPDLVTHGDVLKLTAKSNYLWARAGEWRARCERSIVKAAPRAVDTAAFRELPPELRARLRDLGCIAYAAPAPSPAAAAAAAAAQHRNNLHKRSSSSRIDIDHVRALFIPYAAKPNLQSVSNDLKTFSRKASSHAPKIRTTKAQEERAKFNMLHSNASNSTKNLSKPNKFEKTKPRYLQPRPPKEGEKKPGARLAAKMVSSSESSRNTSPVLARGARRALAAGAGAGAGAAARAPSGSGGSRPRTAEPSTDSLTESQNSNKYATYTKSKNFKGSLESTKSSSQQTIPSVAPSKSSTRTKIPVYVNHTKTTNLPRRQQLNGGDNSGTSTKSNSSNLQSKQRAGVSGSLMMATKSSSAKIVARPKEPPATTRQTKGKPRAPAAGAPGAPEPRPEIPLMERSGTFLKDEPTFGDKTTNIDIAQ